MKTVDEFIQAIDTPEHQEKLQSIFEWIHKTYPNLVLEFKWNQPMFLDHGTFIIGFSVAKKHIAISIEGYGMEYFYQAIEEAGYNQTKMMFRITWEQEVNYSLLKSMIDFKIKDKQDLSSFWK